MITELARLTQKTQINELLNQDKEAEVDSILISIIEEGKEDETEKILKMLQDALIKKPVMTARVGGADGSAMA